MPTELIAGTPALTWPALQTQTVNLTFTPATGLTMSDYATFTLTIREDPLWSSERGERSGGDKHKRKWADPLNDGWAVSTSAAGTVAGSVVTFVVTTPGGVGEKRYALDVVTFTTGGKRVQAFDATWLSVEPSLKAA